ncbi:MAG: Asp-tRNA(Asn)/Glu-tRNA(Gln) amidotransferase subunit GatC [Peptococcaceae bacterium]|jgi:aspartyl-tRNA(Asn)/glutamyl-tRNA(Gln) amidotransferase subunit C|nr:Asp-tRNA(Asn)/Glu-tRNA(Gln) amidotransferase subunit GatC [Peptococcaceae bacterium]
MTISKQDVEHIALSARLKLTEEEIKLYTKQLDSILECVDLLEQIDTTDVRPTAHGVELFNVLREDEVEPSLPQEKALINAPETEHGFFKVPRII